MREIKPNSKEHRQIAQSANVTYEFFLGIVNRAMAEAEKPKRWLGLSTELFDDLRGLDMRGFRFGLAIFVEHMRTLDVEGWDDYLEAARNYHRACELQQSIEGEDDGSGRSET